MTEKELICAQDAFRHAATIIYTHSPEKAGIGTQGERMLHAIIKHYVAPDPTCHEVKIGRNIVDAMVGEHIYEVQTRRFDRLENKLNALLPTHPITIVYPIAARKTVAWLDPRTGELSKGRLSPKKGKVQDALYELFWIRKWLNHPNLSVRILLLEMQEYRTLTGYGKNKKRHAPRAERTPGALLDDVTLSSPSDYASLLPQTLNEFTTKDLAGAWRVYPECARRAIHVLCEMGILTYAGKRGREKLYQKKEEARDGTI